MNPSFNYPGKPQIEAFLSKEAQLNYSYSAIGASQGKSPVGYDDDHNFIVLGKGEEIWEKAKEVLIHWQHFPSPWTKIHAENKMQEAGQNVAVLFRLFGIWWMNSARIVYVIDEAHRFGFAYGTLPGHIEEGEECFWIERSITGEISYHIRAFSKPRFWLARLGYPIARMYQRRFVKQSMARVKKWCTKENLKNIAL